MGINFNPEMKKLFVAVTIVCMGRIFVSISAQTLSASPDASTDEEGIADEVTDRTEQCDCPSSPDGKFAFVLSFGEKDAFEDRPQILDLIEKESENKLQRIDDAEMLVLWDVLWALDSNGFALRTKVVGHPRIEDAVCVLAKRRNLSKDRIARVRCVFHKRLCGRRIQNVLPSTTGYRRVDLMKRSRFINCGATNG